MKITDSENFVAQIILYLRLQIADSEVLDILANEFYIFNVSPSSESVDIFLEEIFNLFLETHFLYNALYDNGEGFRESTPNLYFISPRVLRLEFDSIEKSSIQDFEFRSRSSFDVKVLYYDSKPIKNAAYFRMHYNFNSDALLITILNKIKVESARLKKQQSLLLMINTNIHCGDEFEFVIEFSDISNCAEEYKRNYQKYTIKIGFLDASYLISSRENLPPIGAKYRSKTILDKKTFEEIHKTLKIKNEKAFTIKILNKEEKRKMNEINIISRLYYIS